jgi:hypothetical protein
LIVNNPKYDESHKNDLKKGCPKVGKRLEKGGKVANQRQSKSKPRVKFFYLLKKKLVRGKD